MSDSLLHVMYQRKKYVLLLCATCIIIFGLLVWRCPGNVSYQNADTHWTEQTPTISLHVLEEQKAIEEERKAIEDLAERLLYVTNQLYNHARKKSWAQGSIETLTTSIEWLDKKTGGKYSTKNPFNKPEVLTANKGEPDICPDRFVHANLSEPYFLNGSWVKVNCSTEKKLQDILTVLIYPSQTEDKCGDKTNSLIQQIQALYPGISIIIASDSTKCKVDNKQAKLIDTKNSSLGGQVWNKLVNLSETKYVLLGRGLDHFSWLTQLERQVAVLSDVHSRLDIVGGSVRNQTGHWEVGCYQSQLKFYQLIYKDGYYKSKNECMFCDYLKGPFIARKSLFERISFDEEMTECVVFDEFFLRLNQRDTVMACPDAMYVVTGDREKEENMEVWLPLVKKLELNRLVLPNGIRHKFTCKQSGSSCSNLYQRVGSQYMPVCCMDLAMEGLKAFHEYCVKNNILYYVNSGSALGAIKFHGVIPWDFDGDIAYYKANLSFFEKNKTPFGKDNKDLFFGDWHMKWYGYFRIKTPDFFIEMFGLNETAIEQTGMAELFRKVPTKFRMRKEWFYAPPSPGLNARNEYGKELYRHANSWYNQGHLWFDPYKEQASFKKCSRPGYHYCYDIYPTDGNFDLIVN